MPIDFLMISTRSTKRGTIEVYPRFVIKKSSDLMIRGSDFYAIWVEERGLWSTDEQDAIQLIDNELDDFTNKNRDKFDANIKVCHLWDAETGMIDSWHKYCQKQMRDSFHMLDEKLIFANMPSNKKDYASKRLNYSLEKGDISAYDEIMNTLYSAEERKKIDWAIGAVVSGDSKKIQKFMVLYGAAGTGKSTVLNIIQALFEGYYSVFDAKALGSSSNSFALEAFKANPLVAIQHDGDLSRIEDNTRLNSLVSHELMTVNEKFKSTYANQFKCFLFMGTNKPVKITDAKSGLTRRLIDVSPTGTKLEAKEYKRVIKQVGFELGAIAEYCQSVYLGDPGMYDSYIPTAMMGATNDFYNFVEEAMTVFERDDNTTLKAAWEMYKVYCDDAKVPFPLAQKSFKEELKNYFRNYDERYYDAAGNRLRNYYSGFIRDKFIVIDGPSEKKKKSSTSTNLIQFESIPSVFDREMSESPAQYATTEGTPTKKWVNVKTRVSDLDTSKLHYVKVPENHIVIDFDIPDESGAKCFEKNLEEASKWPATYAELSKSGAGIHLHYIYKGDVSKLSCIYDDHIEVKVFSGNSSLRRKLSKCNDLPIATISSGLPLKGDEKLVSFDAIKNEKAIRTLIKRNLNKEYCPGTKPSIDFINKILNDSYNQGMHYDVTDMRPAILAFAVNSSHQADYCIKLVNQMKFKSEEPSDSVSAEDNDKLVFFDVEVFPNLFLVNWKIEGEGHPVVRMINPKPSDIEQLVKKKLVGFNNRRYDNHMLYACMIGYSNEKIFNLSKMIVDSEKGENRNCFFGEAYNLSYTDIYDFAAAVHKQSLKKFEIELGIHHQELGLPWDQPVPEEMWTKVAEYCDNDVIATEATFNYLSEDWMARQILADLTGMTVNDTTNMLTTRLIFGKEKHPQSQFEYRFMGDETGGVGAQGFDRFTMFQEKTGKPIFPGYVYKAGKSIYRDEEVGEGGYVFAQPGMYGNVALLDIASMHPSSMIAEELFGPVYTKRFAELKQARVSIKHGDWDTAKTLMDGKLTKYIQMIIDGKLKAKALATVLKTPINSAYGLTAASFEHPFHDPKNIDNIVAKRGALFMVNLKHEVQKRGFIVAHIKTDSIKIPDATPEIIKFVMDYGKMYGYDFEHEATYERICLVNNAVYIAKYQDPEVCTKIYGYSPDENTKHGGSWTATGTQFQIPYVFKKLFSKEDISFEDLCIVNSVKKSNIYLDMNELLNEGEHDYRFVGRIGMFCPILAEHGGGALVRDAINPKTGEVKYDSVSGSKGYHWLEAEMVKELGKENDIDRSYFDQLCTEAISGKGKGASRVPGIADFGDFEWFISDDPYIGPTFVDGKPVYINN